MSIVTKPSRVARMAGLLAASGLIVTTLVPAGPNPPQDPVSSSEISSQDSTPSFRIQVERNLVQVRVVVRDANGRPVGNLTKDNFILTDNGKPQIISHFAMETPVSNATAVAPSPSEQDPDLEQENRPVALPDRYIALFFDDIHIEFADLARTREAAEKYLSSRLQVGDRVGIFTSSGQKQLDFTDDQGKLHEALRSLQPRPIAFDTERCPEVSGYQGYLIESLHDPTALEIAIEETRTCDPDMTSLSPTISEEEMRRIARASAEAAARRAVTAFQSQTEYALRGIDQVIRLMANLPGQRTLVLVSPGFLMMSAEMEVNHVIDRALHSNVIVNALDAKGLYAPIPLGDASRAPILPIQNPALTGSKMRLDLDRIAALDDVMHSLAFGTGGVFFTNNNDLDQGFQKTGALPEVYYTLAFSPQNIKFNGAFRKIKVALNPKGKFEIQARNGYFAPQKPADPTAQAKEELEQAIFSQAEVREFSVDIQIQFFKLSDTQARLAVLAHLNLGDLHFRKEADRNMNDLTVVAVLFDRDGRYLAGKEKHIQFRLRDGTYERLSEKGITSKTSFDVIPGTYTVRLVVRDSEGAQISALNKRVEIPL